MRPATNMFLQLTALWAFLFFRLATPPGWMAGMFLITLVGPVLVVAPTVHAVRRLRPEDRLSWPATVSYSVTAASLVVAGALIPETDDQHDYLPLLTVFAPSRAGHPTDFLWLWNVGWLSVLTFLAGLVAIWVSTADERRAAPATAADRRGGER